ncbi:hypothetical protein HSIEG1_3237 [Enterococcus sp. HSIEG1]|nr:hypothetical protein HSIEG1_3237 [Enterococcus sp. HSIEG1]
MVQKPFFDYRHKEVSVSHERPEKRVVFAGNLAKTLFYSNGPIALKFSYMVKRMIALLAQMSIIVVYLSKKN